MGITERKQRDRERRVNEILDAAMRVFLERDISGTTVDAIANAAEISKGQSTSTSKQGRNRLRPDAA